MKVIVAGYSKTGTKSLNAALTELGYKVYDYPDNLWYLGDDWIKILTTGGTIADLKRMYKDVDAVVDAPAFTFWEEIHQAFPEAKIILTLRDEESWFKSFCKQMDGTSISFMTKFIISVTPVGWKSDKLVRSLSQPCYGLESISNFNPPRINELLVKQKFRRHNSYVLQNAPKEKLLVYSVKEGWNPLCEFLGKDIPDKPFPHKNIAGTKMDEMFKDHPVTLRMKREFYVIMTAMLVAGVFGGYKLYKHFSCLKFWSAMRGFSLNHFRK